MIIWIRFSLTNKLILLKLAVSVLYVPSDPSKFSNQGSSPFSGSTTNVTNPTGSNSAQFEGRQKLNTLESLLNTLRSAFGGSAPEDPETVESEVEISVLSEPETLKSDFQKSSMLTRSDFTKGSSDRDTTFDSKGNEIMGNNRTDLVLSFLKIIPIPGTTRWLESLAQKLKKNPYYLLETQYNKNLAKAQKPKQSPYLGTIRSSEPYSQGTAHSRKTPQKQKYDQNLAQAQQTGSGDFTQKLATGRTIATGRTNSSIPGKPGGGKGRFQS